MLPHISRNVTSTVAILSLASTQWRTCTLITEAIIFIVNNHQIYKLIKMSFDSNKASECRRLREAVRQNKKNEFLVQYKTFTFYVRIKFAAIVEMDVIEVLLTLVDTKKL